MGTPWAGGSCPGTPQQSQWLCSAGWGLWLTREAQQPRCAAPSRSPRCFALLPRGAVKGCWVCWAAYLAEAGSVQRAGGAPRGDALRGASLLDLPGPNLACSALGVPGGSRPFSRSSALAARPSVFPREAERDRGAALAAAGAAPIHVSCCPLPQEKAGRSARLRARLWHLPSHPRGPLVPVQAGRSPATGTSAVYPCWHSPLPTSAMGQSPPPAVVRWVQGGRLPSVSGVGFCAQQPRGILCSGAAWLFLSARAASPCRSPPAARSVSCVASESEPSITSGSCGERGDSRDPLAGGGR